MFYALLCKDKPGHLQLRLDTRPVHVAYLNDLNARGILKFAGPFLDEEGKPNGSLVMLEVADKQAAREIGEGDPYAKAGLFESVEIRPWNWTFNNPASA